MDLFVIIKEGGYDINGNHLFRVKVFEAFGSEHAKGQFVRIGRDGIKQLVGGRYNPNDGSVTTQWSKEEILAHIKSEVHCEFGFVFE